MIDSLDSSSWAVGVTGCSVCLLRPDDNKPKESDRSRSRRGSDDDLIIFPILRGHTGPIRAVAEHPLLPVWATVGTDKTLRIWNGKDRKLVYINRLWDRGCTVAFHPKGHQVVVGTEEGEVIIMECGKKRLSSGEEELRMDEWAVVARRSVSSQVQTDKKPAGAPATGAGVVLPPVKADVSALTEELSPMGRRGGEKKARNMDITSLKFSPDGTILAIGSRDLLVHLLSVEMEYKRVATCRGSSTPVIRMDFSVDGTILQTNDLAREILFWEVATGRQVGLADVLMAICSLTDGEGVSMSADQEPLHDP